MMFRKIIAPALAVVLFLSLSGCSADTSVSTKQDSPSSLQTGTPNLSASRTIVDLGGNTVALPPAEKIQRVVIISPPTTSLLLGIIPNKNRIVGVNSRAFTTSNPDIISKLFPDWQNVETKFVSEGFVSNTEELLNLRPDIVFYYGQSQKSGIEGLGIPTVDFLKPGDNNPETVTIAWDKLMREIFQVEGSTSLEKEWALANQKAEDLLHTYAGPKKSALFVFSNTGGKITVYGGKTYADTWFAKSGLSNAAAKVQGSAEVSMEQIYAWNPDLVYVFIGSPATLFQTDKIQGQDWSRLKAYQTKAIYDIPQAAYSWGAPCSDSPLMPLWLIQKSYPELLSEENFKQEFRDYYQRMYGIKLEDELMQTVLSPRKPQNK